MQILPKRRRNSPITSIENLEIRNLLSGVMSAAIPEAESNDTLDQSMDLGPSGSAAVDGAIDRNGADVDWYAFTLLVASEVTLDSSSGTVGLYNNAPGDPNDLLNPYGHRLLAQATAEGSTDATITRSLAAGTYYVAVSGKGNSYFNPYLADSGLAGETGTYTLEFSATAVSGPVSGDPTPLAIDASSVAVSVDFGNALNFVPAVELFDSNGNAIPLAWTNYNSTVQQLQFVPNRALATGNYTAVIKDAGGNVRSTLQVEVAGSSNTPVDSGDDTPATAIDLGELEAEDFVQVAGVIGDDPYYDFSSLIPGHQPGNDVDLYHFHVSSESTVGFQAEVFARRFGSALDSGISLFRMDPVTGHLVLVTGNNDSSNSTPSAVQTLPLYRDSIIGAALEAGDYYLAVSDGLNTLSPLEHQSAGNGSGIFNPEQSHSGSAGTSTGAYVLNMRLVPLAPAPEVVSVSIADQSTLSSAPTELTMQFSQFVNITDVARLSYASSSSTNVSGIWIQDGRGNVYVPRLTSFDPTTFTARFAMIDRLPPGSYQLRVDGSQGLTNLTGTAVTTDTTSFKVSGPTAGTAGNPLVWTHDPQTDASATTQPLGTLFPSELATGVSIVRSGGTGSNRNNDQFDEYSFSVTQNGRYSLSFGGAELPSGVSYQIFDQQGNAVPLTLIGGGALGFVRLTSGNYTLRIGDWPANSARSIDYQFQIRNPFQPDDAVPLFSGAAPAIGLRLVTAMNGGGSGGVGSGGGGSGGGLGGGIGGGSGGGTSGGGISDLGTSSRLNNPIDSPNDYIIGQVGNRLGQLSTSSGIVVAIPTLLSDPGTGLGSKLQVSRSLRRSSLAGDGLAPGRLSELADGPMGRSHHHQTEEDSNLSAVRKLSRLIDSQVASKRDADDSQKSPTTNSPAYRNENADVADHDVNVDPDTEIAPTDDGPGQPESNHTTATERSPGRLSAQIGDQSRFDIANDLAFILHGRIADKEAEAQVDELQSADLPDTLFAAGVGLLIANAVVQGNRESHLPKSRVTKWHFTSTNGLHPSRKSG